MYKIFITTLLFCCLSLGLFADSQSFLTSESQAYITRDQIIMTDNGIFINMHGMLLNTNTISHIGNGIYQAEVYGACRKCGSVTIDGKCQNRNCDGYGPPKD